MKKIRLIPRLDIKGPNLIKGIHLEGLRVVGSPQEYAQRYYQQGADELLYMDAVASLYGRNSLGELLEKAVKNIFIPITVGGGIRTIDDAIHLLRCGADKVAINTAAVTSPTLISVLAERVGSQSVVLSVDAKQINTNQWEVYIDGGRERTGLDVLEWVTQAELLGVGEILLTSIDREGTRKGYDIDLVKKVSEAVSIPVIASGGMGKVEDLLDVVFQGNADAVAMADILHYQRATVGDIRCFARQTNIEVRTYEAA